MSTMKNENEKIEDGRSRRWFPPVHLTPAFSSPVQSSRSNKSIESWREWATLANLPHQLRPLRWPGTDSLHTDEHFCLNAFAGNRRSRRLSAGRKAFGITAATLPRLASIIPPQPAEGSLTGSESVETAQGNDSGKGK
ncbi:hypothetical protein T01_2786 [Trichinella spiralis]|uniref:Uncharacterized protein n=1 Tax=Trichinella spiralis TaxID=6334 RepID=A0A0V1AM62_TRISP|nr:hypothetical protein T01_2786 [Trichinella spiralis]